VIEALRLHTLIGALALQQPLALFHGKVKFDRHAVGVNSGQRTALIGSLDERVLDRRRLEVSGLVEILRSQL
jgi:hypothetical protein